MRVVITPTDRLLELDGVPVRLWEGATEDGVRCLVYVHRIAVPVTADPAPWLAALGAEVSPPRLIGADGVPL